MARSLSQRGPALASIPLLADQKNVKNKRKPCMHEARTLKKNKKKKKTRPLTFTHKNK